MIVASQLRRKVKSLLPCGVRIKLNTLEKEITKRNWLASMEQLVLLRAV